MASDIADDALQPLVAEPDPLIGTIIDGKYQINRLLGAGGMGAVYEAHHRVIGKRVAVKVLHREFCSSAEIVQRFQREARAATQIGHPHIVEVFDMGTMGGGGFFQVLELLEGRSLGDELELSGPLSYARAVHILSQVADALAATHEKGVIHRDLKPDNVFLVRRGDDADFVKLLDFGVAKIVDANTGAKTRTGMAIGTPSYMSPEQAQGASDIDLRTDIFALGVMTFEMLAGTRPFDSESFAMTIFQVCMGDTPELASYRDDVPDGLQRVIARMLEKKKEHRFASCREVKAVLAPYASLSAAPRVQGVAPERAPLPISAIRRMAQDPSGIGHLQTITPTPSPAPALAPSALVTGPLSPIREEPLPVPVVAASVPAEPAAPAPTTSVPSARLVDVAPGARPERSRGIWLGLAMVAVFLALAGVGFMAATPAEAPVAAAPTTVRVAIRAEPLRAELFVDEIAVSNPYVIDVERSTEAHMIEARLDGYGSVQRALTFDGPIDVTLALAPVGAAPVGVAPEAVPDSVPETVIPASRERSRSTGTHLAVPEPTGARITVPDPEIAVPDPTPRSPGPVPDPDRAPVPDPDRAPPQALKTVVF